MAEWVEWVGDFGGGGGDAPSEYEKAIASPGWIDRRFRFLEVVCSGTKSASAADVLGLLGLVGPEDEYEGGGCRAPKSMFNGHVPSSKLLRLSFRVPTSSGTDSDGTAAFGVDTRVSRGYALIGDPASELDPIAGGCGSVCDRAGVGSISFTRSISAVGRAERRLPVLPDPAAGFKCEGRGGDATSLERAGESFLGRELGPSREPTRAGESLRERCEETPGDWYGDPFW